ncbi:MAG: ABC transporter ATP-binding protein, partial [Ignavibacteriales bacterium]|nr:ABC transporter ATP-binding protein [Ignavibacteriales bacterium]
SLIKPLKGDIKIFGKSLVQSRIEILKKIGAIVEKPDFYTYLTAYKNLEILGKISGCDVSQKRIFEILELVGLKERAKSKVKTYSHGMKQRLGIAQALLHDPELIILDEPTTGLDPQGMKEIRDLIMVLSKEKGKTVFLSSHILSEVEQISNRMIIINKGKTQVEGSVEDLLNEQKLHVTFEVDDVEKCSEIIATTEWNNLIKEKQINKIIFDLEKDMISELNKYLNDNNVKISAIIPRRSLEEYFLKITMEGGNAKIN